MLGAVGMGVAVFLRWRRNTTNEKSSKRDWRRSFDARFCFWDICRHEFIGSGAISQ